MDPLATHIYIHSRFIKHILKSLPMREITVKEVSWQHILATTFWLLVFRHWLSFSDTFVVRVNFGRHS